MCYFTKPDLISVQDNANRLMNITICTWNIQGAFSKGSGEQTDVKTDFHSVKKFLHKHSIICLTETWANESTVTALSCKGYELFHSCRKTKHKNAKKESGGVAVLIRKDLTPHIKINKSLSDDILWIKVNQKVIRMPFNLMIGTIYLPPENSSYTKSNLVDNYRILEKEILKYKQQGKVLLCGDFNSRVGNMQDYIHSDSNDPHIPLPISYAPDKPIAKRNNLDTLVNNYGKCLIDTCIGNDLCIINGRVDGDRLGNVTCVKTNGVSTVDFNIIEKDLLHMVKSLIVLPLTIYSDHKPSSLQIMLSYKRTVEDDLNMSPCPPKYLFNGDSVDTYKHALRNADSSELITNFNQCHFNTNREGIDSATENFTLIVKEAANKSLHIVRIKKRKTLHKPWYTKSCHDAKSDLLYLKGMHEKFPLHRQFREDYYCGKKLYKKLLKNSEDDYNKNIIESLNSCNENDANKFWKEFNKLDPPKETHS